MNNQTRLEATRIVSMVLGLTLMALFISAGISNGLTSGHVVLGVALTFTGMGSIGFIWTKEADAVEHQALTGQEKAKRQALDDVLRNMSDADLETLKQRLSDGFITDEMLYDDLALGDDGEWVQQKR